MSEETDTEKQFSLSSKSKFDLPVEKEFSATQSPEESVSPLKETSEISPVHETLDIKDMAVSVGRSPSDFHFDPDVGHRPIKHDSSADEGFSSKHGTLEDSTETKDFDVEEEKAVDTTGDSLLEDEVATRQFTQTEKIMSKEEHKEQTVASSESQIQELIISKDTSGPVPQLIVEQKTFSTHDKDSYSKLTVAEEESTLQTKETITEELDFDEEGNERKKEKKELVSSLQHKSDLKEDELETKTSAKREDTKETIYPFGRDSSPDRHLLDTVGSKEEVLETTLRAVTESGTCLDDTMKQNITREYKVTGDEEQLIPGTEKTEEDRTVSKMTTVVETGDLTTDMTKHDAIREVLFDVEKDEASGKPIIEPSTERYGEKSEHVTLEQTYHSKETDKQEFKESKSSAEDEEELELQGYEYGYRGHRDSGHFEEESSDDESQNEAVDRSEHLQNMAFDNMAFEGQLEDVKQKHDDRSSEGAGYLSPSPSHSHQMPISPDDMEERHTRFDFAEELKQEMYDSGHLVKGQEGDKTLSLSEVDVSVQMAGTPGEIREIPADEGDKFIGEDKKVIHEADDHIVEGAVGPDIAIVSEGLDFLGEESSSSSESPCENEIFDRYTGSSVPWEIASQYRRQFSDSFIEQEHPKQVFSTTSLDMGVFYRRDSDKDSDVTFLDEQKKGSSSSSDEVSPTTKKKMQKVRFSLSEDHHFDTDIFADILDECAHVHSYDMKMNEEWLKSDGQTDESGLTSSEPHEKITEAYQQAVLASIESRLQSEMKHMEEMDDFEEIQQTETELVPTPTTSVKITSAEATESLSREKGGLTYEQKECTKEDVDDMEVNAVFSASKPLSVVSRESRLAHEELLRESFDEKDRSISPSIDSEELSTTYESQKELQEELDLSSLANQQFSASHQDESSETDRDTAEEERLSPIEEISGGETADETIVGVNGEKSSDKKVTFQTDMQHLCSVSSEELVKTSTSSSEVEPTLLAASYDLDSGRVSHVVTTYDLSPDTVEKQFLPVGTTSKAILSSPEDDVFEADVTIASVVDSVIGASGENEETPTEGDIELLPRDSPERISMPQRCESGSTGTGTIPSPPAPSPFEVQKIKDTTTTDLEVAALKMRKLQTSNSNEKPDLTLELMGTVAVKSTDKIDEKDLFEEESSPFEVMSPSELEGYADWLENQKVLSAISDDDAQPLGSSFTEVEKDSLPVQHPVIPAPVVPTAPPLPSMLSPDESTKDSSFEHSSPVSSEPSEKGLESPLDILQQDAAIPSLDTSSLPATFPTVLASDAVHIDRTDLVLPNGPTEVEYNPEIDLDFSGSQPQHLDSGTNESDMFIMVPQTDSSNAIASVEPLADSNEPGASGTRQTELTESVMEELQVQPEGDLLVVSDQTLYGLEMPSDEAASLTTSHVDSYGRVEESDSLNVSVITSTHDDTSEQIDSREALGQIMGIDKTDEDISERPTESIHEMEESPVTHSSKHTFGSETLHDDDDIHSAASGQEMFTEEVQLIEIPEKQTIIPDIIPDTLDPEHIRLEATPLPYDIEESYEADQGKQMVICSTEEDQEELAYGGDDRYTPEEPKGTDDEDMDEELIILKENSDYDVDTRLEEFGIERVVESAGSFELKADSCDLDRPLTPTPVDKKQGFFDDKFQLDLETKHVAQQDYDENVSAYPKGAQENLIEQTACKFVETVLEEVKSKVKSKVVLELDEDIAIIQSPSSETGGDFTEMPDELPFDEPAFSAEEVTEKEIDNKVAEDEIQKPVHLTKSSKPLVLIKQFSEEVPEITLSQHLNESDEDVSVDKAEKPTKPEPDIETVTEKELCQAPTEVGLVKCVPEMDNKIALEEQISPSVHVDVSISRPKDADYTDHGKVCVPESADDDDADGIVLEPLVQTEVVLHHCQAPLTELEFTKSDTVIRKASGDKHLTDDADQILSESVIEDITVLKECQPPTKEILIIELDTFEKAQDEKVCYDDKYLSKEETDIVLKECHPPLPEFEVIQFDTMQRKPPDSGNEDISKDQGRLKDNQPFLVKGSDFGYSSEEINMTVIKQSDEESKSEQNLEISNVGYTDKDTYSEDIDIFVDAQVSCEMESTYSIKSDVSERKLTKAESEEEEKSEELNKGYLSSDVEDAGDSSSVDSFTTVVAADEEEEEDEDRLADFASLTSSIHSDIQSGVGVEEDSEQEKMKDPLQELIAWAKDKQAQEIFERKDSIEDEEIKRQEEKKADVFDVKGIIPFPWIKDEEDSESLEGSDRYDYVDRTALSVITELSEEDRFEIIEKDELESESTGTGSDSRHYSSPDFPPPSPMSSLKFFSKSGEKDDISVSSSLLEFERLEREIDEGGSKSSSDHMEKSSLGGSLDETKFLSKSLEKDDASVSSSLADFERLERECNHGSSDSSIEKILSPVVISSPETGKSSISGSATSLSEFERLEKECMITEETRRSSVESYGQKSSVTSSQGSLYEFERLEQELVIAEKLEAEAQKIVSILESGSLFPNQYSSEPELSQSESLATTREILLIKDSLPKVKDDMDRDSIDGRDDLEDDSLSENKKKTRGDIPDDTDSLDGDQSEMTTSVNSMILTCESQTRIGHEFDADSLHDSSEGAMKISTDSLGERLSLPKSDKSDKSEKEKSETDSLQDQEGVMDKSADSLELNQEPKSESPEKVDSDSLGQEDVMQSSADSLESYQIEAKDNIMEVSMESTGWSSASSMFSRSSLDTMKSAERDLKSDSGHSKDVMETSLESWEEYPDDDEEETDNFYIISKYQTSIRQAAESSKFSSEKTAFTDPYLDYEGNITTDNYQFTSASKIPWDESFRIQEESKKSPYLSKGKYEPVKKIWSMTEWEAMKKAKKQEALEDAKNVQKTETESKKEENAIESEIVKSGRTVTQVVNTSSQETQAITKTTETVSQSGETDKMVEKDIVTSKTEESNTAKLTENLGPEPLTRELPSKIAGQGTEDVLCCMA